MGDNSDFARSQLFRDCFTCRRVVISVPLGRCARVKQIIKPLNKKIDKRGEIMKNRSTSQSVLTGLFVVLVLAASNSIVRAQCPEDHDLDRRK